MGLHLKKISSEEKLFLSIIKTNFSKEDYNYIQDIVLNNMVDWKLIFDISRLHQVAVIVYKNILRIPRLSESIPKEHLEKFKLFYEFTKYKEENLFNDLTDLMKFFLEHSIEMMLLKGGAFDIIRKSDLLYASYNDLDILLYTKKSDDDISRLENELRSIIKKKDWRIEFEFFTHHDIDMNGSLEFDYKILWQNAQKANLGQYEFYIPGEVDMILLFCINGCRKRYFRFKYLLIIDYLYQKLDHKSKKLLIEKSRNMKISKITYTTLRICEIFLKTKISDEIIEMTSPNRFLKYIIEYLIRNMSLSTPAKLYEGNKIMGKPISLSLLLPYCTYSFKQIIGHLILTLRTYRIRKDIKQADENKIWFEDWLKVKCS